MLFCLLCGLLHSYSLFKYSYAVSPKRSIILDHEEGRSSYGFESLFKMYFVVWIVCYASATIFHTKDTYLTERMDYYSAFVAAMFTNYINYIRILWIRDIKSRILLGIPPFLYTCYHIYYLQFISFNYAYNAKVVAILAATTCILWLGWSIKNYRTHPHVWLCNVTNAIMCCSAVFEIYDFPPLFGYIDPHSLWHLGGSLVTLLWGRFLIRDAEFYLRRSGKRSD